MKNILDYRLIVLDKDANIVEYPLIASGMHQECLDDFARKNGYNYSSVNYLVQNGNVIFKNAGLNMVTIDLPGELSDDQLYQMDYLHNWLKDVELLAACKYVAGHTEWYQFEEHVADQFSNVIIQSYYTNKKVITR